MFRTLHRRSVLAIAAGGLAAPWVAHAAPPTPGVTKTTIKIGQTMPYSGPASALSTAGRTEIAFFKMLNAQGGINGRTIEFTSVDDGYSPPRTVEETRRLVEAEGVAFLFNGLGTPTQTAVRQLRDARSYSELRSGVMTLVRALIMVGVLGTPFAGGAAELEGVTLPDTERVAGTELRLNGIGLRAYSVFQVPIYVAGLYLVRPSNDANQILRSPDTKVLEIRFVHDVSVEQSRKAWRDGFDHNCVAPCQVAPQDLERFLSFVPAVRNGDSYSLLFNSRGVEVMANGRRLGSIPDPLFAQAMLTTFLGPQPPTARLKRELLGARE